MAVDYADLFTDVGKMLKYLNVYAGYAASAGLNTDFEAIADVLTTNDRFDILSGLPESYTAFRDQAIAWCNVLAARIELRFQHFETVASQLPVPTPYGTADILREMIYDMITNSQDVDASTVTVGSPSAGAGNIGDVTVLSTLVMDGYNPPRRGMVAHPAYRNVTSELAVTAETMTFACTDMTTAGREQFTLNGGPTGNGPFDWRSEGSGSGDSVLVGNGRALLANSDFETFTTTNVPDSWTMVGTVTTHYAREASSPKRGTYALKFIGDGSQDPISASQAPAQTLTPLRSYCFAVWVKGDASTVAGALTIQFEGTGYTAGAAEKIEMDATALSAATSWTLKHFFVNMPATIPSDLKLMIKVTGGLTNTKNVRFDGAMLTETVWHGGVGWAMAAGAVNAVKGDRYSVAVSNNNAGVFQTFMRQKFGVQLPSVTDTSETIADTLAT